MPYRKGPAGTAERKHAELVKTRGACERCGSSGPLECAHIIRRRFVATRTNENAAWCLCHTCHNLVDENQAAFMQLVEATIGVTTYEELWHRAHSNTTVWRQKDWQAESARLHSLLKALA